MRFIDRVEASKRQAGCWPWFGGLDKNGYGECGTRIRGKKYTHSHAAAYALLVGDCPEGLEHHHTCRNRWCVNPEHIPPVPKKVNLADRDMSNTGRKRIDGTRAKRGPRSKADIRACIERYRVNNPDWKEKARAAQRRYEEKKRQRSGV